MITVHLESEEQAYALFYSTVDAATDRFKQATRTADPIIIRELRDRGLRHMSAALALGIQLFAGGTVLTVYREEMEHYRQMAERKLEDISPE